MSNGKRNNNWPRKIGLIGAAIVACLAERGAVILSEMLNGGKDGLMKKLNKIDRLKDVDDYYKILSSTDGKSIRTILWRLQERGFVKKENKKILLTSSGTEFYKGVLAGQIKKKWDGKWRIVMFDIPESKRKQRDWIRYRLIQNDYRPLQKSVLIGKQPIEIDFMEELLEKDLYKHVKLVVVGEIDDKTVLDAI